MKVGDQVIVKWLPVEIHLGTIEQIIHCGINTIATVLVKLDHKEKTRSVICSNSEVDLLSKELKFKIGEYVVLKKFNGDSIKKFGTVKEYDSHLDLYLVNFWFRHIFPEKTVGEWLKAENLINADPEAR